VLTLWREETKSTRLVSVPLRKVRWRGR
jgi:hypothetical protein